MQNELDHTKKLLTEDYRPDGAQQTDNLQNDQEPMQDNCNFDGDFIDQDVGGSTDPDHSRM